MFVLDEAPLTCEAFIAEGGMQIFLRILEVNANMFFIQVIYNICFCRRFVHVFQSSTVTWNSP